MSDVELPHGWAQTEISEILVPQITGKPFQQGWSPQCLPQPAEDGAWGVLKTTAIQESEFWAHQNKALPASLDPKPNIEIKPGDVLMTCAGPRNRCGVACYVKEVRPGLMMSGKMYRFRPDVRAVEAMYLMHFLTAHDSQVKIDRMKTGINDSGLNLTHDRFSAFPIIVPPLPEQKRIVAKIEELFIKLDKGIECLRDARAQLKLYRQSLLKHAFEGKLTADWRAANADKLETPAQLLARIKLERISRHTQQMADWKQKTSALLNATENAVKPQKPKPLRGFVGVEEPEVLENQPWPKVRLGDVISVSSGIGLTSQEMHPGPFPVYGGNGVAGYHDQFFVNEPTLILGRVGAKCGVAHITQPKSWITDNALIVSSLIDSFDIEYFRPLLEFMNLNTLGSSTGQPVISGSKIYPEVVSLPPKVEQTAIAELFGKNFSQAEALQFEIETQLAKANALRQSILKQAFSGKLVPQDPNDEPASVLLERLRAERAGATPPKRQTRPRKAKEAA